MVFSKAIQIKHLVNEWNKVRGSFDFGRIKFECYMFADGHWSVLLRPVDSRIFFSSELNQLVTLYADGGFIMHIGSLSDAPYIDMQ